MDYTNYLCDFGDGFVLPPLETSLQYWGRGRKDFLPAQWHIETDVLPVSHHLPEWICENRKAKFAESPAHHSLQ